MSLSDQMKRDIEKDLFYVGQHIVEGRLAAYIAEIKATKPCVINPDTCDWIVEFFEAFQNLRPLCEKHFSRWKEEAARIKKHADN